MNETTGSDVFNKDVIIIPDEGTRKIQADIYKRLKQKNLTVDYLEKVKEYLDIPMVISYCAICEYSDIKSLTTEEDEKIIRDIQNGECECETEEKTVATWKLLHLTCTNEEYYPVLMYLLQRKISDVDDCCFGAYHTPVQIAVMGSYVETLKLLIANKADVNPPATVNDNSPSPLYIAIQLFSNIEIVEILLSCDNIDVNADDENFRGRIIVACMRKCPQYLERLLQLGAKPNGENHGRAGPLMYAVSHDQSFVKTLVKYGADVNLCNVYGDSPLFIAAYSGDQEMMGLLLELGADPNCDSRNGDQPLLMFACYEGDIDMMNLLLKYKADPKKPNNLNYTPLHIAAWNGHVACVKRLLEMGAVHDSRTKDFNTPLALAAHGGYLQVIKELLPLGCKVNNKDKDRDTPLHYAAYNGMTEGVELLISYGADPNLCNSCAATPLWNAVYNGKKETVKLLLKANVLMECKSVGIDQHSHSDDVRYIYDDPKSPLWVAVDQNYPEIALLLVSAGYDIYKENWLSDNAFPEGFDNDRLRSLLVQYAQTPPKLTSLCRNYFRRFYRHKLSKKVEQMDLPLSLKSFLTLSDLHYVKNEKDTSFLSIEESDED